MEVAVAGVAALLVAKAFKIYERFEQVQERLGRLSGHREVGESTRQGLHYLRELFSSQASIGVQMASNAMPGTRIERISTAFAGLIQLTTTS